MKKRLLNQDDTLLGSIHPLLLLPSRSTAFHSWTFLQFVYAQPSRGAAPASGQAWSGLSSLLFNIGKYIWQASCRLSYDYIDIPAVEVYPTFCSSRGCIRSCDKLHFRSFCIGGDWAFRPCGLLKLLHSQTLLSTPALTKIRLHCFKIPPFGTKQVYS